MRAGYFVQVHSAIWAGQVPEETPPKAECTRPISPPLLSSASSPLHPHTCPRSLKRLFPRLCGCGKEGGGGMAKLGVLRARGSGRVRGPSPLPSKALLPYLPHPHRNVKAVSEQIVIVSVMGGV